MSLSYGRDPTRHTVWLPHTFDMNEAADIVWNALENAGYLDDDDVNAVNEVRDAFNNLMMTLYVQSGYSNDSDDPWA